MMFIAIRRIDSKDIRKGAFFTLAEALLSTMKDKSITHIIEVGKGIIWKRKAQL